MFTGIVLRKGSIIAIILSLVLGAGIGYTLAPREVIEGVDPVLHQNQIDQLENMIVGLEANNTLLRGQVADLNDTISLLEAQLDIRLINISFSRTEYARGVLIDLIERANKTIYVMVMALTADELADSLIAAYIRGVNVTIIIDNNYKTSSGSDYQDILDAGVDIRTDNTTRLMHHKVMVVDGYFTITGSYNWSASAEDKNWENIIVLKSKIISDIYLEEFYRIWQQTTPGG